MADKLFKAFGGRYIREGSGKIIGVEDPYRRQSRQLTPGEKLATDIGVDIDQEYIEPAQSKSLSAQAVFPEEQEIERLKRRIELNLSDVQGTRSSDEARIRQLINAVQSKREAITRAEAARAVKKTTPSQDILLSTTAQNITRKMAGTFGKGLSRAEETGVLKRFKKEEEKDRQILSETVKKALAFEASPMREKTFTASTGKQVTQFKLPIKQRVAGFAKRTTEFLPSPALTKTNRYTTDVLLPPETPKGISQKGTIATQIREKTFYELYGLPKNSESQKLEKSSIDLQSAVSEGIITENQASLQLQKETDDYIKKQMIKDIPKTSAIGLALGALSRTNPLTASVGGAILLGDMIYRRNELIDQAVKYPAETALQTISFIAGAKVGGAIGGRISRLYIDPIGKIDIKPSITELAGKTKDTFIREMISSPELKGYGESAKNTQTVGYRVLTKEGKIYDVVQFGKNVAETLKSDGKIKGDLTIIAKERGKLVYDSIKNKWVAQETGDFTIGRGIRVIKGDVATGRYEIVRVNPRTGVLSKVKRVLGLEERGKIYDVLEKTRLTKQTGRYAGISEFESRSKILSIERLERQLANRVESLKSKAQTGKNINNNEIRQLLNIERKLSGENPFTLKEWKEAGFESLSQGQVKYWLDLFPKSKRPTMVKTETPYGGGLLQRIRQTKIESVIGKVRTIGLIKKQFKAIPRKILTRQKTKGATLGEFKERVKEQYKSSGGFAKVESQFSKAKKTLQKRLIQSPAFGAITAITAKRIPQKGSKLATIPKIRMKYPSILRGIVREADKLSIAKRSKVRESQTFVSSSASKQREGYRFGQSLSPITIESQKEKLSQTQIPRLSQRLTQKQRQRYRFGYRTKIDFMRTPKPRLPRRVPPIIPKKPFLSKKIKPLRTRKVNMGYNVYIRKKGKYRKIKENPLRENYASSLGAYVADQSLAASYKIKRANKPAKNPTLIFPLGYYSSVKSKFYPSKRNKGVLIERRERRLDTSREVKKIQAARLIAGMKRKTYGGLLGSGPKNMKIKRMTFKRL